jgi:hypothetical protein
LWKLDGNSLKNKAGNWKSTEEWNFRQIRDVYETLVINGIKGAPEKIGTDVYIEKTSEDNKVLGLNGDNVITEVKDESKGGQQWFKGWNRGNGYFTLKSSESQKVLTAISGSGLTIKDENPGLIFSIILVVNHSLFTLPYMLVILLSKIYYWSKGDGKKELKREKTGNYAEVTDLSEIDEESNSEEPWTYLLVVDGKLNPQNVRQPAQPGLRSMDFMFYQIIILHNFILIILSFALEGAGMANQILCFVTFALVLPSIVLIYYYSTNLMWTYFPVIMPTSVKIRYYPRLIKYKSNSDLNSFNGTVIERLHLTRNGLMTQEELNAIANAYFAQILKGGRQPLVLSEEMPSQS